jgi:uncharacterized protein YbaP (TraB family)
LNGIRAKNFFKKHYWQPYFYMTLKHTGTLIFIFNAFCLTVGALPVDKGFLYEAEKDGKVLWLYGTLPKADKRAYPLPEKVYELFEAASALVVEVNPSGLNRKQVSAVVKKYAVGSVELRAAVGEPLYAEFEELMESRRRGSASFFKKYRPWFTALILERFMAGKELNAALGIDRHFLKQAAKEKKKIIQLEDFEEAMAILAALPDTEECRLFEETLRMLKSDGDAMQLFYESWLGGDIEGLNTSLKRRLQTSGTLRERLLRERNVKLAGRIDRLASENHQIFIILEAVSLVGSTGVPELLRRQGFTVKRI